MTDTATAILASGERREPSLPGLPPDFRWVVSKPWYSRYHWVDLQKLNAKEKWKTVASDRVTVSSWAENYRPSSEEFPDAVKYSADRCLLRYREKQAKKQLHEDWVGIYEPRKVSSVSERVRRQDNDR